MAAPDVSAEAVPGSSEFCGEEAGARCIGSRSGHPEAVMKGLNALRRNDILCDVELVVEGRKFKAHRVVLASCSDFFRAMFSGQMLESKQAMVSLNGVTARSIEMLIEYVYTSNLVLDHNNIVDMLSASTYVQMKAVVDACSNYLGDHIDLENCVFVASIADLYSLEALKNESCRFMCSHLKQFSMSPDFHSLSFDQVVYLLASDMMVNCTEERVLGIMLQYCVQIGIKPEQAACIFAQVRFDQIAPSALDDIKRQMEENHAVAENRPDGAEQAGHTSDIYWEVLRREMRKQHQDRGDVYGDIITGLGGNKDNIGKNALLNHRGMELVLVKVGGFETLGVTRQLSYFRPSTGKWQKLSVIPQMDQNSYGVAVLGNDIYIVGDSCGVCLDKYIPPFCIRYCPTEDKWTALAHIRYDKPRFSLTALGSKYLFAVGGVGEFEWPHELAMTNVQRYNADTDTWEYMTPLPENRSLHAGVVVGEKLYISGGTNRHMVLKTFWCMNMKTGIWSKLRPMLTPRAEHVLLRVGAHIYACGGFYEKGMTKTRVVASNIDVYDIENNKWRTETAIPEPRFYMGIAALRQQLYFVGGLVPGPRSSCIVQCYDLGSKKWTCDSRWEYPNEARVFSCVAVYLPRNLVHFTE